MYPSIILTKFSLTNMVFCSLFDQDEITRLRTEVGALKDREGSLKLQVGPLVLVDSVEPLMERYCTSCSKDGNFNC